MAWNTQQPLSVSDAVAAAKAAVEGLPQIMVVGEVSGFRGPARTGHCYFQLKDEASAMDAIIWRGVYQSSGVQLRDGLQIVMTGSFQVYAPTGRLSFVARHVEASGEGLLRQQVAALAKRLEAEGLMDAARKRKIPVFCTRIAVVTSPTGSVIDDVKRTLARRNPLVEILVSGCAVQGEGAAQQIVQALRRAAAVQPEAILLVRGGGSYEDLMTFNDESLARAVASCPVPVVTGIGHEPDTCICDMVADRRCSTPTAAAESVAPAFDEILRSFHDRTARLARAMQQTTSRLAQQTDALSMRAHQAIRGSLRERSMRVDALAARRCLQDPLAPLVDRRAQVELSAQRLHEAGARATERLELETPSLAHRLTATGPRVVRQQHVEIGQLAPRMQGVGARMLRPYEELTVRSAAQLDALSPLKVLGRGYSIVRDEEGHVVSDAQNVEVGAPIEVLLAHGTIQALTQKVIKEEEHQHV